MDPLGVTASIIALLQLSTKVTQYVVAATGSAKTQMRLHAEIRACECMLFELRVIFEDEGPYPMHTRNISFLVGPQSPFKRLEIIFESIKAKICPKKGLGKVLQSLAWPFQEREVTDLIAAIQREKSLLQLILATDSWTILKDFMRKAEENNHHLNELMQALRCQFDKHDGRVDELNTALESIQVSQRTVSDGVGKVCSDQAAAQRQRILDWITPKNFTSEQEDHYNRHAPGTGHWLIESDKFKAWEGGDYQTLYCLGIPGSGKTVLASLVVHHIQSQYQSEHIGIAYIYCNFRRRSEQTPKSLNASLLRQLTEGKTVIHTHIMELYNAREPGKSSICSDDISTALRDCIASYSRVFVVIDAIDELDTSKGYQNRFLTSLDAIRTESLRKLSLFVTSRKIPDVAQRLQDSRIMEIRATEGDIRTFIQAQMSRLPAFVQRRPDLQCEITAAIIAVARGMFLLAELHVGSLVGSMSPKAIRNALKKLPTGNCTGIYEKAYRGVMQRIHEQPPAQYELACQVLKWITCARRTLRVSELRHALAVEIDSDESFLDLENLPQEDDLVSVCAGFVTVDKTSGIIRFVHQTAQNFFESMQNDSLQNEMDIAAVCIKYLSLEDLNAPCASDDEYDARLKSNPFFNYAVQNWGHHARDTDTLMLTESILQLLTDTDRLEAMSQGLFCGKRAVGVRSPFPGHSQLFPRQMSGLHLAAYFGLKIPIQSLISTEDPNFCDSTGMPALSWAAMRGHLDVIEVLVGSNASINKMDSNGVTPLLAAARNGHQTTVDFLLGAGANTEASDCHGRTSLSWAAARGHHTIVSRLLEFGADAGIKDENGRSPLLLAARHGFDTVVKLLLQAGAETDAEDMTGRTPLSWAVEHSPVVKLLLSSNATADTADRYQRTPISYAASGGHKVAAALLLAHETDVNFVDVDGLTPLAWATMKGHEDIASLLRQQWYGSTGFQGEACPPYETQEGSAGLQVDGAAVNKSTYSSFETESKTTWHIAATSWDVEQLDPRYRVENGNSFQPGEIFKVLWSEPQWSSACAGGTISDRQTYRDRYGGNIFVGFRRFVVIANDAGHCTCVPILTYGGKGCTKRGVKEWRHGIVHMLGEKPRSLRGEPKLGFPPVEVEMTESCEKVSRESRINYGKLVTVEHNVKVFFIGRVSNTCWDIVTKAVNQCWEEKIESGMERKAASQAKQTIG